MTVQELIEKLSKFDGDDPVKIEFEHYSESGIYTDPITEVTHQVNNVGKSEIVLSSVEY